MNALLALIAGAVLGIMLGVAALSGWETRRAANTLDRWRAIEIERVTSASLSRSRGVVRGQITEQVAPLLPSFPWNPTDARFLGKPIDYMVFDGYGEVRAGTARSLRELVFVDVKTGQSGLSRSERRVRLCVEAGAVRCVVVPSASGPPPETVVPDRKPPDRKPQGRRARLNLRRGM